jgi:hypothetical protein
MKIIELFFLLRWLLLLLPSKIANAMLEIIRSPFLDSMSIGLFFFCLLIVISLKITVILEFEFTYCHLTEVFEIHHTVIFKIKLFVYFLAIKSTNFQQAGRRG